MLKDIDLVRHKKILSLAIPAALNSLLSMVAVLTDLIMVGKISPQAVASVGLGLQTLSLVFAILTLLHVGTSALLSRLLGAKDLHNASLALSSLLRYAFFLSIPVSIAWYIITPKLYIWFQTTDEVTKLGHDYVSILTYMLIFIFVKLVFETAITASKNTKVPFLIKFISISLNILLNWILIYGHLGINAHGVKGAAIATVIVNIIEMIIYLWLYLSKKTVYMPMFRYSKELIKRALKVGIPASIERSLTFTSFMLFTMIIAKFGTKTLAGYQIGLRIEGLAFMPGIGFTIAAMVLMGQGLGAKNPKQSQQDVMLVLKYTISFMFLLGVLMIFIPEKLSSFFSSDKQTIEEASKYLKVVGFSQIPLAYSFVLSGALRGAGDSKRTLRINLISLWFVRIIPAIIIYYLFKNIILIYYALIADTFVKSFLLWYTFKRGKWKKIKI